MQESQINFYELRSPELLRIFGFPTTLQAPTPDEILRIQQKIYPGRESGLFRKLDPMSLEEDQSEKARLLLLPYEEFRKLHMWEMDRYPRLFAGDKGPNCEDCKEEIVLPIDLRRAYGINLHGQCYAENLQKELKRGTDQIVFGLGSNTFVNLEYRLRIARVCHPDFFNGEDPAVLTRHDLDFYDIKTRDQLETLYWKGQRPKH